MMWETIDRTRDLFDAQREEAVAWCEGRSPWPRWPLFLYLAYALLRHLTDAEYRSWFGAITLVVHEAGHLLFAPFGRTLMLLGGSITQLAVPALVGVYLLVRQKDWFGLVVGLAWHSFSSFELATYVADANKGNLALVGFGDNVVHDWDALLTQWHLLNHCETFAAMIRMWAAAIGLAALALGGSLLWTMHRQRRAAG
jgi:hypothetical protein